MYMYMYVNVVTVVRWSLKRGGHSIQVSVIFSDVHYRQMIRIYRYWFVIYTLDSC